jgi:hypothetical protein
LAGAGEEERWKGGGRGGGRGGEDAVLEGEAEVGIGEGDVALVVGKDEGTFHEEDGGEFPFLWVGRGRKGGGTGGVRWWKERR